MDRNDPCFCGSGKKFKKCHLPIVEKIIWYQDNGAEVPDIDIIKTIPEIEGIRKSAKLNTAVLDEVASKIKAGMSTDDIDKIVYDFTTKNGGIPAPLNYEGFPKSVCTSVNDVVCHGIPSKDEILKDGDIINVDVSTIVDGYYSDASRMFEIGNVSEKAHKMVEISRKACEIGLSYCKPWNFIGDMGQAIADYVHSEGCSVVRDIGGHGIGNEFHEEPFVPYLGPKGTEMLMVPGMIFTIEPMINEGTYKYTTDKQNGWTNRTKDHKLSAQTEYMVLITEDGYEILTK